MFCKCTMTTTTTLFSNFVSFVLKSVVCLRKSSLQRFSEAAKRVKTLDYRIVVFFMSLTPLNVWYLYCVVWWHTDMLFFQAYPKSVFCIFNFHFRQNGQSCNYPKMFTSKIARCSDNRIRAWKTNRYPQNHVNTFVNILVPWVYTIWFDFPAQRFSCMIFFATKDIFWNVPSRKMLWSRVSFITLVD